MNSAAPATPAAAAAPDVSIPPASAELPAFSLRSPASSLRPIAIFCVAVCVLSIGASGLLWQKLSNIQEQLARQSADAGRQATEARAIAKEAQDLVRETAARVVVSEARLSEVALQRSQLEELMQSLSRSRDENLVVDMESALRLAQQQAQLAGSVEPLLAALKSADLRLTRAAQPRLVPLQRAVTRDIARVKAATVSDTSTLLTRLDELTRLADELPVANAVAVMSGQAQPALSSSTVTASTPSKNKLATASPTVSFTEAFATNFIITWAQRGWNAVLDEARGLVRVSHIAQPEAALLSPEQSFFVRENLKLKLLNARLGLLARQMEASRADLAAAALLVNRYFDASARRTQTAAALLLQVQAQMKTVELPRVDDTLTALATAASGR
jgi:uroporphyrin-III C-methyltransferase